MLRSLLINVWEGFETVLRHYVIFKNLNLMHMNSPGGFHWTIDVMSNYKQTLFLICHIRDKFG